MRSTRDTGRSGFTLIELLTVMGVMILISTIVVASGFGMRRGAAINAATQLPYNVMEYARQHACMDGRMTAVMIAPNGTDSGEYAASVFQVAGYVSFVPSGGSGFADYYSDVAETDDGGNMMKVFNFKTGKTFVVGKISHMNEKANEANTQYALTFNRGADNKVGSQDGRGDLAADGMGNRYWYPVILISKSEDDDDSPSVNSTSWPTGSAYGFEIADRVVLPNNFTYELKSGGEKDTSSDSFWILFYPDGTVGGAGNNSRNGATIEVTEAVGKAHRKQEIAYGTK